jgi:signal transduction histidine kinase
MKQRVQVLYKERKQTDSSLSTERGKTDESLGELRKKAENETDAQVRSDRKDADEVREQGRSDEDSLKDATVKLKDQRACEDVAVELERSSVDAALKTERSKKEAVLHAFLNQERGETDQNLSRERLHTDQVAFAEVDSHTATKALLTSRDEFLSIVSHDLKNPIGAVLSCAEMLLEDSNFEDQSKETKYWISFIKRNAETSLRLISDLLDMERIAQGKLQVQRAPNNLSQVVREVVDSLAFSASSKQILLRAAPFKDSSVVNFDHDRISQVISNLVANAIKFSNEGGLINLKIVENENEFEVSVSDNGPGIPNEKKAQIFSKHMQLQNKDRQGLGLGLYIAKTIVDLHGGKLSVNSEVGVGSIFSFTLPKRLASATLKPQSSMFRN